MDHEEEYRYLVFISHSHYDKSVARWLKQQLIQYQIPELLLKQEPGLRKYRAKIFLDDESAAASHRLDSELEMALATSRYLIIICSPFAVASEHVHNEIAFFKRLDRAKNILCLVASGVPNATDQGQPGIECFPRALRQGLSNDKDLDGSPIPLAARPLAAHFGETKSDHARALDQIIAGLFDISTDRLSDLQRRSLRARAMRFGLIALLMAVTGYAAWIQYFKETTTYFTSYVRRWGRLEGLDRLSPEKARQRESVLAFVTTGRSGNPKRVEFLNGSGECPQDGLSSILGNTLSAECSSRRGCSIETKYRPDGSVDKEILNNQFGQRLETLQYNELDTASFIEGGFGCARTKSGVEYVRLHRYTSGVEAGLDERIEFLSANRDFRENHQGAFAIAFEYDSLGRIKSKTYQAADGANRATKDGPAKESYRYDDSGNLIEAAYFGVDGKPVLRKDGYARYRSTFDTRGNRTEVAFFGLDGKPVFSAEGIAGFRSTYDERGNVTLRAYFGLDGNPVRHKKGNASWRASYDARGNEIEKSYFDLDGKPVLIKEGYAGYRSAYDERGNRTEVAYFGLDGKPVLIKESYAGYRSAYDERGNEVKRAFLGLDGKPKLDKAGVAYFRNTYNERGNRTEVAYFGLDGKPVFSEEGIAGYRSTYDERGNKTEESYFGLDGNPVFHKDGYAGFRSTYDERGNETEVAYFGLDGKPVFSEEGIAGYRSTYDERGNKTEVAYFGLDGKPVLIKESYAGYRSAYDERGNRTEEAYFGLDGKPIISKFGFSFKKSTYGFSTLAIFREECREEWPFS